MKKPRLFDRLLTICLCVILVLAFWCLSLSYGIPDRMLTPVI
jgi:hypothetical protein